jgi:hypothetical protein
MSSYVVIACCILHNIILSKTTDKVAQLLEVLQFDGMALEIDDNLEVEPPQHMFFSLPRFFLKSKQFFFI